MPCPLVPVSQVDRPQGQERYQGCQQDMRQQHQVIRVPNQGRWVLRKPGTRTRFHDNVVVKITGQKKYGNAESSYHRAAMCPFVPPFNETVTNQQQDHGQRIERCVDMGKNRFAGKHHDDYRIMVFREQPALTAALSLRWSYRCPGRWIPGLNPANAAAAPSFQSTPPVPPTPWPGV